MKKTIASTLASLALAATLVACGGKSAYSQQALTEVSGVKITAENAADNSSANTAGALTVSSGDVVVISPDLTSGSVHLTITSADGATTVFDDKVDGRTMFTVAAAEGKYDVKTTAAKGATGSMLVIAESQDELIAQNEELSEALKREGLDPSIVLGNGSNK